MSAIGLSVLVLLFCPKCFNNLTKCWVRFQGHRNMSGPRLLNTFCTFGVYPSNLHPESVHHRKCILNKKEGHCLKSVITLRSLFSIHNIPKQHFETTCSSFSDQIKSHYNNNAVRRWPKHSCTGLSSPSPELGKA